jgi:hypothetical protein
MAVENNVGGPVSDGGARGPEPVRTGVTARHDEFSTTSTCASPSLRLRQAFTRNIMTSDTKSTANPVQDVRDPGWL